MKDPVVQAEAPVLRAHAVPVPKKDIGGKALNALIKKMKDTLRREEFGVAIAAPQVGASLRLFVVADKAFKKDSEENAEDAEKAEKEASGPVHTVFINPELMRLSRKKLEMSEGCLSVRGKYGTVLRHEKASIKALDEHGKPFIYHGSGLLAHIFQHEVDHLNGILYIDKAITLEDAETETHE
jgi:peptide deformylase